jgi:hypothetical protein
MMPVKGWIEQWLMRRNGREWVMKISNESR